MQRLSVFLLLFLSFSTALHPETFLISILSRHDISALVISPERGKYRIIADGKEIKAANGGDLVYVSITGDALLLRDNSGGSGSFLTISLVDTGDDCEFSVRPVDPAMERVYYSGGLHLSVEMGRISAINEVCEELYLAGVVEAEAGLGHDPMYYRAQAVISRTYLYGNLNRHSGEGFHLCDEVHCQVYKGRMTADETVHELVKSTSDLVITYEDTILITAAYHSNCGGETVNSEEVWLIHRPYLRSVSDPFCLEKRNSVWERSIEAAAWGSYLADMGFEGNKNQPDLLKYDFTRQPGAVNYHVGGFTIPMRKIRSDWNLRSAFFDVITPRQGSHIILSGRGYGHGVGLCQEGAMEMARRGYNFIDILQFYYRDVGITSLRDIRRTARRGM